MTAFNINAYKKSDNSTKALLNALSAATTKKFKKDERYWELSVDKAGNGFAEIRFLDSPPIDGDAGVPFVHYFSHGFKNEKTGQWYIERSLTSLGKQDPVSDYNSKLWASGLESNKQIARDQKRQLNYVSNILVVNDSANPDNNGKVFLYRYGSTIYDMIQEHLPENKKEGVAYDPDFLWFNPFNLLDGANFKLKARIGANKRRSYDKSGFTTPTPLAKTAEEIGRIWNSAYSLLAEIAESNYKSYADLKARLDVVLGLEDSSANSSTAETSLAAEVDGAVSTGAVEEEDADLALFRKLADE